MYDVRNIFELLWDFSPLLPLSFVVSWFFCPVCCLFDCFIGCFLLLLVCLSDSWTTTVFIGPFAGVFTIISGTRVLLFS